eukprot:COSAG01_NODE_47110_length_393_cov_1.435374_1_plen_34_part_10
MPGGGADTRDYSSGRSRPYPQARQVSSRDAPCDV